MQWQAKLAATKLGSRIVGRLGNPNRDWEIMEGPEGPLHVYPQNWKTIVEFVCCRQIVRSLECKLCFGNKA